MISEDVLSTEHLGQTKPINLVEPVVSVCIITYNHAPFIKECLDSVLAQDVDFPYEIIVGEDNSTDGTRQICIEYAEKYPDKIRLYLRRPDQKIEVNGKKTFHFNFIENLKAARGEYIALLDGDDFWIDNHHLTSKIKLLMANDFASFIFSRSFNGLVQTNINENMTDSIKLIRYFHYRFSNFPGTNFGTYRSGHLSTWVFKKNLLSNFEKSLKFCSGGDTCLYAHFKTSKTDFLESDRITSVYRVNPQGVHRSKEKKKNKFNDIKQSFFLYYYVNQDFLWFIRTIYYLSKRMVFNYFK
jgi:glycosyltransferase involved in cell wall biosynthesis